MNPSSGKEPWAGSFDLPRREQSGKARPLPRDARWLFWLSALLLLVAAYLVMAPDAPNLPLSPEQSETVGRTAW